MAGYPECPHCPYKDDPGKTCHAFATRNRRICELIETGRQWEARVREMTEADPVTPDAPSPAAPQPPPVVTEGADLVPVAVSLAVTKCPHRTKLPACGCQGKWRCERDAADVAWADCVACKTAEADAHASQPDQP